MKSKTCCFTGHRILPDERRKDIIAKLEETVVMLIRSGYLYFGVGGALGFDTLCAKTVLHLRQSYPAIKLILVLPCVSQADRWSPNDQAVYREMMRQALHIPRIYKGRSMTGCGMQHRKFRKLIAFTFCDPITRRALYLYSHLFHSFNHL